MQRRMESKHNGKTSGNHVSVGNTLRLTFLRHEDKNKAQNKCFRELWGVGGSC